MASVAGIMPNSPIDTTTVVNRARFLNICYLHNRSRESGGGIGTLNEKRIHLVLKDYFDPDRTHHEIPHKGYIADIKNDDGIIEIQTGALNPLFSKLGAFLPDCRVTLVHPLIQKKSVSWIDPKTGDITPKKNSPRHETPLDGVIELYNIRSHVGSPNLHVRFPLIEVDEYRFRDGWSRDKKRGSHRYDRIPIQLFDIVSLDTAADYMEHFLPGTLRRDPFTTADYAEAAHTGRGAAYHVLTVLTAAGVLEKCGKRGNSILYSCILG